VIKLGLLSRYSNYKLKNFQEIIADIKTQKDKEDRNLWYEVSNPEVPDALKFSWEEFYTEAIGLLIAGFETTSNALCWILWSLETNPGVKEKLKDELKRVVGNRLPTVDDLPNLPYLESVVLESLRYHGTINASNREAMVDETLGGFNIPKGTQLFVSPRITVKNAFENPQEYDPERFTKENMKEFSRLVLNGFGAGPHACIGKNLALLELRLVTAVLVLRDVLKIDPSVPPSSPHFPMNSPSKLDAWKIE